MPVRRYALILLAGIWLSRSEILAETVDFPAEPGWLRKRECLDGQGRDTLAPPGGLGSPRRLRVLRGGEPLLQDQDFRLLPGDSSLVLAAPLDSGEALCLDKAYSPLLADPVLRLYRMEEVPYFREGLLDSGAVSSGASRQAGAADAYGSQDSLGGYRLNYSGSKSMAVTMGSGGGVGLDAALFINLEGQVAENVFVEGQLSDQNVPVQPEGNTATLKEVDTKYMRVYGRDYAYILGNYMLDYGVEGEDAFRAKVQGVDLNLRRGQYAAKANWSVAEGQYSSDTLRGVDGKQRGYYLRGRDGRQFITVLAGTERLWRNGTPLRRGVDYTIDYSEGRVDFLNTVIVTSENLFSAEFQYTEQDYGRSLGSGTLSDTSGAFTWSLRAITEGENKDRPLTASFDRGLLARFAGLGDSLVRIDSLGRVAMPARQSLGAFNAGWKGGGHDSRAALLVSQHDRNLFSSRDDDDNVGLSTRYRGSQGLGRPLDRGGLGRADIRLDHEYRSGTYRSFKQLTEPRGFLETWNLDARVAESGFLANRLRLEERPYSRVLLGLEAGRAETVDRPPAVPGDTAALPPVEAVSRRGAVFGRLGGERTYIEASTEAKLARDPERRDNYRQSGRLRLEASGLTPSFTWVRNEWLAFRPGPVGGLARSIKQEPEASLSSRPLFGHVAFTTATSVLSQQSNFDGRLGEVQDSVRDWGASQKVEVMAVGPWTSDIFYSYRNHREWRLDPFSNWTPEPQESDFNQVEWINHLSDHRRGYGFTSTYRVNQTAELPLVEAFERVKSGCGNYVLDSALNTFHEVETCGDHVLVGLRRDTTFSTRPYQDLAWTANLELTPARFPFQVKGFLADVEFMLDLAFDHQDTSGDASLLPLFTDGGIEGVRAGRSRYSPSLHWKSPGGRKAANIRMDRAFERSAGFYAHREERLDERVDYRQEVGEDWEYALDQAYGNRDRTGLATAVAGVSRSESWIYGARLLRKLPRSFSLEGRGRYEVVDGVAPSGRLDLQGVRPALKLEKSSLYNGRAFVEYGAIYYWGRGEGSFYATDGFRKGLTHRLEANAHFQVGEHMHLNFDYVVRLEPGASRPSQKLAAEARAVF